MMPELGVGVAQGASHGEDGGEDDMATLLRRSRWMR